MAQVYQFASPATESTYDVLGVFKARWEDRP